MEGEPTFVGLGLRWQNPVPLFVPSGIPHDTSPSSHIALSSQYEDVESGDHQIPHSTPKSAGCHRLDFGSLYILYLERFGYVFMQCNP
jgi:hypothetical protein